MPEPWWRSATIYQIYPRSFADANGDGVGDLRGITSRLVHVCDLGADAVWLSPVFRSPMADFGYDVSDYTDIDPIFGTLDDMDALIACAHELGLRVLLDFVPNHSSDRHPWFEESRASLDNPRRDWYVWRPGDAPPNNWIANFGDHRPAWTRDDRTGEWYLHSFLPEQPDLNWDNPEVRAAMHDVLRFWLRRGVDGFRIDVAHRIGKDPELADNEPGRRHDEDWPSTRERFAEIRAVLEEFDGDRVAVGEVYLLDQRALAKYVTSGDGLHMAHNFFFLNLPWSAVEVRAAVDEFEELTTNGGWPAWCLNNHDHSRTATRYGLARARVAAVLLLTLRGTPFVYQGEDLGLTDAHIPPEVVVDVDGRDPERAPMPWALPSVAGPSAGFGDGEPWLPVHQDAERLAVEAQKDDAASSLSLYRSLLALRRREPALTVGAYRSLDAAPDVFAYVREHEGRRLAVVLNFAPFPRSLPDDVGDGELLLSTHSEPPRDELAADEGRVVLLGGA